MKRATSRQNVLCFIYVTAKINKEVKAGISYSGIMIFRLQEKRKSVREFGEIKKSKVNIKCSNEGREILVPVIGMFEKSEDSRIQGIEKTFTTYLW